jgi:hypothetical protein
MHMRAGRMAVRLDITFLCDTCDTLNRSRLGEPGFEEQLQPISLSDAAEHVRCGHYVEAYVEIPDDRLLEAVARQIQQNGEDV